jgi:glyoxylase-like metal-dependent hydrolase (beta-lactamase superfamily II)
MPLAVDRFPLGEYQSNCYVVRTDTGSAEAVVLDPGGVPTPVTDALERFGARVAAILVTHTDVDHIAGVAELAELTGAEVWAPAEEADGLREGRSRTGTPVRPYEPEHVVRGGDRFALAGLEIEVVDVPGHSAGHVAFSTGGAVFSGDLLFAGSVGRVDLPGGDWQTLLDSVQRLLERVGPDATIYPGHGEPTTIGREFETNPFLAELRAARRG